MNFDLWIWGGYALVWWSLLYDNLMNSFARGIYWVSHDWLFKCVDFRVIFRLIIRIFSLDHHMAIWSWPCVLFLIPPAPTAPMQYLSFIYHFVAYEKLFQTQWLCACIIDLFTTKLIQYVLPEDRSGPIVDRFHNWQAAIETIVGANKYSINELVNRP